MNIENAERQEKLLSHLHWLTKRCNIDFKGNPPPFEQPKHRKLVERANQHRANALAAGVNFLPSYHVTKPLGLDATRIDHLKGVDSTKFSTTLMEKGNSIQQKVNSETGFTEIQTALCWDIRLCSKQPQFHAISEFCQDLESAPNGMQYVDSQRVHSLPPQEHIVGHPGETTLRLKLNKHSAIEHANRWLQGSQMVNHSVRSAQQRVKKVTLRR
ncbi:unnamed protein product [Phytomonas sp. Hart1]|nr:unnamed protein product [Phytomonas sp. Hart1]|eukprot:CCW67826.1 unnamed protein product [Phytomonas sp. isolate Hart1]